MSNAFDDFETQRSAWIAVLHSSAIDLNNAAEALQSINLLEYVMSHADDLVSAVLAKLKDAQAQLASESPSVLSPESVSALEQATTTTTTEPTPTPPTPTEPAPATLTTTPTSTPTP